MTPTQLECIIEAALMVAGQPLTVAQIQKLFAEGETPPTNQEVRAAIEQLQERFSDRGVELQEVSSGFQFQTVTSMSPWLSRLWDERPPRYSRAFLETLAIIAYRQPVTRAEIEDIRGVGISSSIFKTLLEREWIRLIGYKDVPGKPAIYGTTKTFLDHFKMKSLRELPSLADVQTTALANGAPVQLAFDNSFASSSEEEGEEQEAALEQSEHEAPELHLVQNEEEVAVDTQEEQAALEEQDLDSEQEDEYDDQEEPSLSVV